MMKITGLSHLFKWENLHNWWLTKYFFAPLYAVRSPAGVSCSSRFFSPGRRLLHSTTRTQTRAMRMWTSTPLALHQDQRRRTKVHIALIRYHALNFDNFLFMAVCISLSPFRCLLQTVTMSLHCSPITSLVGPLFCDSVEK